jgi:hypothetical protein
MKKNLNLEKAFETWKPLDFESEFFKEITWKPLDIESESFKETQVLWAKMNFEKFQQTRNEIFSQK